MPRKAVKTVQSSDQCAQAEDILAHLYMQQKYFA